MRSGEEQWTVPCKVTFIRSLLVKHSINQSFSWHGVMTTKKQAGCLSAVSLSHLCSVFEKTSVAIAIGSTQRSTKW